VTNYYNVIYDYEFDIKDKFLLTQFEERRSQLLGSNITNTNNVEETIINCQSKFDILFLYKRFGNNF
jgi:hypothetical protein